MKSPRRTLPPHAEKSALMLLSSLLGRLGAKKDRRDDDDDDDLPRPNATVPTRFPAMRLASLAFC